MKKLLDKSYFQGTNRRQHSESGRSLVEMLGTIAIIGVITAGSITAGSVGMTTWRTNELRDDLDIIMQTIVDLYSWNRNGFPDSTKVENLFCKEGGFHRCICKSEDCSTYDFLSPWDTEVFVSDSGGDILEITVKGIPVMACRQIEGGEGTYWEHLETHSSRDTCPDRGVVDMTFQLKDSF